MLIFGIFMQVLHYCNVHIFWWLIVSSFKLCPVAQGVSEFRALHHGSYLPDGCVRDWLRQYKSSRVQGHVISASNI